MLDALHHQAGRSVSLGEVAHFIRGVTFKPEDVIDRDAPGAIWCLRTRNVQSELDTVDVWGLDPALVRRQEQIVEEGDILVSTANSWNLIGKCSWLPRLPAKTTFGGFVSVLRAKKQAVEPRYLYRWFSSEPVQALVRSFGRRTTNISNLDVGRCLGLPIPLPPLSEQRRIAAILDQADALRATRRASLAQLEQMAQSIFVEMFGADGRLAKATALSSLAEVVRSGTIVTYGIVQAGKEYSQGVPYIRTGDLIDGRISLKKLRHTDPAVAAKFKRSKVEAGDIVMSIRATVGTTAMVPVELDGANLTQGTARISPGESIEGDFLISFLRSRGAQEWIAAQVKGATFREITLTRLRELPVPIPPKELQSAFSERVAIASKLAQIQNASAGELDTLFASLQHRAFRGEL